MLHRHCHKRMFCSPQQHPVIGHASSCAKNHQMCENLQIGWTPYGFSGGTQVVKLLMKQTGPSCLISADEQGLTPIRHAVWGGNIKCMKVLAAEASGHLGENCWRLLQQGWVFVNADKHLTRVDLILSNQLRMCVSFYSPQQTRYNVFWMESYYCYPWICLAEHVPASLLLTELPCSLLPYPGTV